MEEIDVKGKKWQAAPGLIYCQQVTVAVSPLAAGTPLANKTSELMLRVLSVGPDIVGIREGDIVTARHYHSTGAAFGRGLFWVHVEELLGRMVPADADASATKRFGTATEPDSIASLSRRFTEFEQKQAKGK
jgi:hypothetical protein